MDLDQFFWDAVSSFVAPLFYSLLDLSCTAVLLGLIVLLLRRVFDRKISPLWKNLLWVLVIFALVMPNFVESQASIRMDAPFTTGLEHRNQQQWELESTYNTYLYDVPDDERVSPTDAEEAETLSGVRIFWDGILPLCWLLGMIVMMGILLATRQKMVRGMRTTNGRPYDVLLADCKRQLNITQTVEIVEQAYLKSPALWGLFRPEILLPDYVAEMSQDSQKYILLHELSHLKHHDLWKNTLLLALQIVYWFNPLVWVLFRFIRQDMELLNDERVLKILEKSEETPYAMSLIEVLGHANKLPLAPQMLCMVDNKENTKRRIQMIQLGEMFKKHKIIIAVGCLAVIGVLSALFLTAQPEAPDPGSTGNSKPITLEKDDIENVKQAIKNYKELDDKYFIDGMERVGDITYAVVRHKPSEGQGSAYLFAVEEIAGALTVIDCVWSELPISMGMQVDKVVLGGNTVVVGTVLDQLWLDLDSAPEKVTYTEIMVLYEDGSLHAVAVHNFQSFLICASGDVMVEDIYFMSHDQMIGKLSELPVGAMFTELNQGDSLEHFAIEDGGFENQEQELVDDPQPLTADELAYFNETYFTSDPSRSDINMANQFLHNPFDLPININLHSLFYLGAGAEYAMSEDGEYDAVAKAYGFDSWAKIPTDVTPIPRTSMDDILEQYTGIDLFATNKVGLDSFKYLEEYDCYYNLHGDTNYYGSVEFVWGAQMGDRVSLHYYNGWQDADYILTLVDYGGGDYKIYSNLPAIIEE